MKKATIFGIDIPAYTFADIDAWTQKALLGSKQCMVAKANSEFLLRSVKNPDFKACLQDASLVVPDGIGVLWATKYASLPLRSEKFRIYNFEFLITLECVWQMVYSGTALVSRKDYARDVLPERLSGVEVFYTMLSACEQAAKSVYLYGAKQEVLELAVAEIRKRYPHLVIAGYKNGYDDKGKGVIREISESGASLLIVALGSPEQEYWIRDNLKNLPNIRVAVGEGGSFDYVAGKGVRAPKFVQQIGLEWLWRGLFAKNLTGGGHRLRRVWNAVPVFIYEVVKWKIGHASVPVDSSK